MTDILLDQVTGDIDISTFDLQLIDGIEGTRQRLKIKLQFFLGEWFLDQRQGIPYYEKILIKNPKTNVVRGIFRRAILADPGVESVNDIIVDYSPALRTLSLTFTASTSDGVLVFDEDFII